MNVLLDTHTLLWTVAGDPRLSERARRTVLNEDARLHCSIVSLWEIAIKTSIGKLELEPAWYPHLEEEMRYNGVQWLPVVEAHCLLVAKLPFHHRDPFDRMIVSQALEGDMQVVSRDTRFDEYGIKRLW